MTAPACFSRAHQLNEDLKQLLNPPDEALAAAAAVEDGATLLPDYASVEPGALLHEICEVWKRQPSSGDAAHSFANLNKWTTGKIASLQHKLKGRLPIESKEDARHLLEAMLRHWSEGQQHPTFKGNVSNVAQDITRMLFGPIYGVDRKKIWIVESPGINTAKFMKKMQAASAIVFPVLDRAMFGADPVSTLAGTRLSLARYLARSDRQKSGGRVIYALRSEPPDKGLNYVRYLYERSFLATEFRLLQITADKWELEHVGSKLPQWSALRNQLWVCISHSGARTDIIPDRVPADWKDVEELGGFDKCGFVVVSNEEEKPLEYWKYMKDNGAFSQIKRQQHKMIAAHRSLIQAVNLAADKCEENAENAENGYIEKKPENLKEWILVSAEAFLDGKDLPGS